jgi:competence protein ComGC
MLKNEKGMTIIEIIVFFAIIGVLIVAYLMMFTNSTDHIYRMGNKTSAMSDAQEIIDSVYMHGNISDDFIQGLDAETYLKVDCAEIETAIFVDHRVMYCLASDLVLNEQFDLLTVKIFYRDGQEFVTLTSVIP